VCVSTICVLIPLYMCQHTPVNLSPILVSAGGEEGAGGGAGGRIGSNEEREAAVVAAALERRGGGATLCGGGGGGEERHRDRESGNGPHTNNSCSRCSTLSCLFQSMCRI
jgi:hypothetical protein